MTVATITFGVDGLGRGLYTEAVSLQEIGKIKLKRITRILFVPRLQLWEVRDMRGRVLHRAASRRACVDWEHEQFVEGIASAGQGPGKIGANRDKMTLFTSRRRR